MNTRVGAERLHETTKHGTPPSNPEWLVPYRRLDPANAPSPLKEYRGIEEIPLPRELASSALTATAVLSGETGEPAPVDTTLLSTLLFLTAGVTRMTDPPGKRTYFRTAMSAGNLHPVEVYVVTANDGVDGLPAGVYHFSPLTVGLTPLRFGDHRGALGTGSPLGLVLTGIPWRTCWKYGERGWRHLYWDAGTMLANLLPAADAHGIGHRTRLGFDDSVVSRLVGIDGETEMPLAVVDLGDSGDPPPATDLAPLAVEVAPVAPRPIRLPLLEHAQTGGVLDADHVAGWVSQGGSVAAPATHRVDPPDAGPEPIEEVILRRGSTRRMRHRSVPSSHLDWPMAAATRAAGIDVVGEGTLLDHYVNIHDVEDFDPGAHRYQHPGWERVAGGGPSLREASASLCLGQALGGDSAYTVFHCADLDPILDTLGSRGYRVAQLEAGVVSGLLALCAFAVGLGATGLTFLDDAVSEFFDTASQPMLVTSVGASASPPAPAGTPGKPAPLRVG